MAASTARETPDPAAGISQQLGHWHHRVGSADQACAGVHLSRSDQPDQAPHVGLVPCLAPRRAWPYCSLAMTAYTDEQSSTLLQDLLNPGMVRDAAIARLHTLLLRVARAEAERRRARLPARVLEEADDLCVQAANDAVMNILRKLDEFRGAARFTTWACKFVIFEISTRLRRHAWRNHGAGSDHEVWGRLADRGPSALRMVENKELAAALQQALENRLTPHQRTVFQAAAVEEIPIDVLAERFDSSRGAIYKTLHDARRKLRGALVEAGYPEHLP